MRLSLLKRFVRSVAGSETSGLSASIWEKVDADESLMAADGAAFDDAGLVNESADLLRRARSAWTPGSRVPNMAVMEHLPLSMLAGVLLDQKKELHVLDYGGGVGLAYLALKQTLRSTTGLHYRVIDRQRLVEMGRQLWLDDGMITFETEEAGLSVCPSDIVYMSSVLQYVHNPLECVSRLCSLGASYLLFARFSGVTCASYIAAQVNVKGVRIPYRFINVDELIGAVGRGGYDLLYAGAGQRVYPQDNFPVEQRMEKTRDLLFVKRPV